MLDPLPRRYHRVRAPVSSTVSSAFPKGKWVGLPHLSRLKRLRAGGGFRGRRYFVMFRPPSLLAPQIVPTAANTTAGQPGLLRPSRTRFVASPRIGYANRPNPGNWRCRDSHPARLSALSAAPFHDPPYHSARRVFLVTAGRPAYQAGPSRNVDQLKPAPGIHCPTSGLSSPFVP